ncbi:LolA-related protein [Cupriavidus basilensis]
MDQLMSALAQRTIGARCASPGRNISPCSNVRWNHRGNWYSLAPDHLEKRTVAPKPGRTSLLDGDMMTVERGGKRFVMPLQNYPEIAAFIESIRGTLAGNRNALERYYRLGIEGRATRWTLTLTPADSRMAGISQAGPHRRRTGHAR